MNPSLTRALPTPQPPTGWLGEVSIGFVFLWAVGGAVSLVGLVLALQTALSGNPFPVRWHRAFVPMVWATLLPIPAAAWASFQSQRSVWVARVAPRAAAKAVARVFWLTMLTSWAVTFIPLCLMVLLAPPPGGTTAAVLWAAGLCGGTLGFGVIAAAAWRGQLAAGWVLPGLLALLLAPSVLASELQWNTWQAAQGWRGAALVLLAASPALAWWLLGPHIKGHWTGSDGAAPARTPLRSHVSQRLRRFTERFRFVDANAGAVLGGLWAQMPLQIYNRDPEGLLFSPWDSGVTLSVFYRIALTMVIALSLLSAPALHWRHSLAPGGSVRRHLGVNTFCITYVQCLASFALLVSLVPVIAFLFSDDSLALWKELLGALQRYLPVLLAELALGTAAATLLRGVAGSQSRAFGILACMLMAWGCLHGVVYLLQGQHNPVLMRRDFSYLLLLGAATALCIWAAARAWARADLGALLRSSRKRPNDVEDWSDR